MPFDYFGENRGGIDIDVNALVNARESGTKVGAATPSVLSAITQGIEGGVDLISKLQQVDIQKSEAELARNKVAQIGTINQQAQANLKATQLSNEINSIQSNISQQTQLLQLEAQKAKLTEEANKLSYETALRDKKKKLQNEMASSDRLTQKRLLLSSEYADVFAEDPDLLATYHAPLSRFMTQQENNAINTATKRAATNKAYQAKALAQTATVRALEDVFDNDSFIGEAAEKAGITPSEVPYVAQFEPTGKFVYPQNEGKLERNPDYIPEGAPKSYDLIIGNTIVSRGAPVKLKDQASQYRVARSYVSGEMGRRAQAQISKEEGDKEQRELEVQREAQRAYAPEVSDDVAVSTAPATYKPNALAVQETLTTPIVTKSRNIQIANNPYAHRVVQKALGLPDEKFDNIRPDVVTMLKQAETPPQGFGGNYTDEQLKPVQQAIKNIATYSAEEAYRNNPEVQKDYTMEMVKEYHEAVRKATEPISEFHGTGVGEKWEALAEYGPFAFDPPREVKTPEDLYVLTHFGSYADEMARIVNQYRIQAAQAKRAIVKAGELSRAKLNVLQKAQGLQ